MSMQFSLLPSVHVLPAGKPKEKLWSLFEGKPQNCVQPYWTQKSVTKHVSEAVNSLIEMEAMVVFLKKTDHQKAKNVYAWCILHRVTICPLFPGHVLFLVLRKCVWPGFLNHPECLGFSFCVRFCIKALCRNSFLNAAAAEYAKHLNHFECSSCWMQGCQIHICCVEKIRLDFLPSFEKLHKLYWTEMLVLKHFPI